MPLTGLLRMRALTCKMGCDQDGVIEKKRRTSINLHEPFEDGRFPHAIDLGTILAKSGQSARAPAHRHPKRDTGRNDDETGQQPRSENKESKEIRPQIAFFLLP